MLTANFHGDTAMSFRIPAPLRSRSTASRGRRSGKQAGSWRWPILAVVLGLFAHQDALAQNPLTDLTLTDTDTSPVAIALDPLLPADLTKRSFTATTEVTAGTVLRSVPFGVTQVTVTPAPVDDTWTLAYSGPADANGAIDGHQRNLTPGSNTIRVTATKSGETTQTYTIAVTRAAEIGSALSELTVVASATDTNGGTTTVDAALDPVFPSTADPPADDRTFTVKAGGGVTQVTVTATPKDGWTTPLEFLDEPDAVAGGTYQRNLAVGANRIRIRATPDGASGTRDYTITVTRTTTPGAPGSLTASSTGVDGTVRLTWTAPSFDGNTPITGYEFRSKEKANAPFVDGTDTWADTDSATSHDVSGLTNGTTYIFQVRAENSNGGGRPSDTAEATPAGRLGAPQALTSEAGSRRVKLTWTHITDASLIGYQYRQSVGAGSPGGWTNIADRDLATETDTTKRSYTVTGLTNGREYRFQVRGRNSAGGGAASTEVSATPMARPPGAPTNLRATAGDEQVTLSWSAPSDNGGEPITGYEYQSESQTLTDDNDWIATGSTQTTVTVYSTAGGTNFMNDTPYYFRVRAVNDVDCGDTDEPPCGQPSLEVSATPFGAPKTTVSLTSPLTPGDRRVTLAWTTTTPSTASSDDVNGFQYRQKAGSGYGNWINVRNSNASTDRHVVAGLTNGTTYTFQVRAVNDSGGGLASNELSGTPSTTPSAPRLTAVAGDKEVRLSWTAADDGGRRITEYQCRWRTGAETYGSCPRSPLSASATSLTLTEDDGLDNGPTYTFQVRAVNGNSEAEDGWSNEVSASPTDTPGARRYAISATIDGKSWAIAGGPYPLRATVEVNPRFTAQSTPLWVNVTGAAAAGGVVRFGPTDSRRDASFSVSPSAGDITIALYEGADVSAAADAADALAVTRVEIRHADTPNPPTGLRATRGNGEVTLSWATVTEAGAIVNYDYDYRQKRQAGSYGRWTDFAGRELQSTTVTSNTVTGLTDGGTYAFQVRAVALDTSTPPERIEDAESGPSDEVTVSLSGTVDTGGLSAPRNLDAAPGNGLVTLSWTAPATDGGSAITEYRYQQRAGTGAYGEWATIPGGSLARAHTVTGLANGTRYFFRVRAVNSDGPGAASTEEAATPLLNVDTTLRALSLSVGTLAPAFTPATRIYTAAVGSSAAQVTVTATPNKTGAAATITPADANTTVAGHQVALAVGPNRIRVRVTDGTNTGDYTITVTRAGSVPAAPTRLTAMAEESGGAVTLAWTAPTGGGAVSRYEYQQKVGTGAYGAWTPIPGSGPSTTSHIVTGLTNGTAYAFRVRAVNSVGNGAASNEATVTPATMRLVWAKTEREVADAITAARNAGYGDDNTFTAGETVEVRGSSLFNAAEGVSLTFAATSDDRGVASAAESDGTVTVTARAAGMATITITARAPQSGVTIVDQTDPREASIQFDVEVGLEALTLELSGPEDGTDLVEGGRAHANGTAGTVTVRATANRPVTEEVTVTLLPDRAMSDATATADDFTADPIVIEAGETTGLTVVIAVEDGTAEGMEELVLFGLAAGNAGEVTGEVRLRLWDAAVPALPVIAQLLLAAFLLWVSGRRYLLRR